MGEDAGMQSGEPKTNMHTLNMQPILPSFTTAGSTARVQGHSDRRFPRPLLPPPDCEPGGGSEGAQAAGLQRGLQREWGRMKLAIRGQNVVLLSKRQHLSGSAQETEHCGGGV